MARRRYLLVAALAFRAATASDFTPAQVEFFEQRIRPVLAEHCYRCHSAMSERLKAGLRVDSREHLLRGGDSGPAIVPGNTGNSLLLRAISYEDPDLQMPPQSRLPAATVADLRTWIQDGAAWPALTAKPESDGPRDTFDLKQRRRTHWAWQPIQRHEPPPVRDPSWPVTPIDQFILARLEAAGLRPAATADKRVLMRRASFALTGLPPAPAEVQAFLDDPSPGAFAQRVDRWLASPHFGERWARHWLDKVRYAETLGHEFDYPIAGVWRYRDYVVRAFNADLPYNQFAFEQIAGDLLEVPRRNPADGSNESALATAQFWLGQQVHSPVDVRQHQIEFIDNQIDVLTKSFLGLTVSCARCHDHKFDAISTRDYHALYGILASSRYRLGAIDDPAPRSQQARERSRQRDELRRWLADQLASRVARQLDTNSLPTPAAPVPSEPVFRPEDLTLPLTHWFADGDGFAADTHSAGQPLILGDPASDPLRVLPPGWRHSASLSRRFTGALRSPSFVLDRGFIHLWVAGRGARVNVVLEGFTLIRAPIYGPLRQAVRNEQPHWITIDVSMWNGRRAWIEVADLPAADPASELGADGTQPDGWIAVGAVVASALREPPALRPPDLPKDLAAAVQRWADAPATLTLGETVEIERLLARDTPPLPEPILTGWRDLEAAIEPPVLVAGMADGDGWDEPVFIRGNHRMPGELVPRGFLEALAGLAPPEAIRQGSGRRELAEAITHADNPLFARVMVNWVWAHLFGRGLVVSVDNFGVLGEPPTHPELLDWLADDFRRQSWSVKSLIRQIVLSRTWQLSATLADPEAERRDPGNRLWHRAQVRRLEAEVLRDALLAVSGRLDPRVGGPPVPAHLTPFMDGRGRPAAAGPVDGEGRRSLYLEVRRNFLSPFMLAFDAPVPASTVGQRNVSNLPAQALALMNDPLVAGQAAHWSRRLLREFPDETPRLQRLYFESLARPPSAAELVDARRFLDAQRAEPDATEETAWADLCHVLFNLKEFAFIE